MDWKNKLIKIIEPELNKLDIAHRIEHCFRVYKNCELIGHHFKKVNYNALFAACFLHDIGQTINNFNEHGHNSIKLAKNILLKIKFPEKNIPLVLDIIIKHDDYLWVKNHSNAKPNILEVKIFQDADRLESIGAMGIIRQFLFAGKHNKKIYDDKVKSRPDLIFGGNLSGIHTIRDHEQKIYKYLNTKIAKKMAKNKYEFAKLFLKQFFKEWEFEYYE